MMVTVKHTQKDRELLSSFTYLLFQERTNATIKFLKKCFTYLTLSLLMDFLAGRTGSPTELLSPVVAPDEYCPLGRHVPVITSLTLPLFNNAVYKTSMCHSSCTILLSFKSLRRSHTLILSTQHYYFIKSSA